MFSIVLQVMLGSFLTLWVDHVMHVEPKFKVKFLY